MKSERKNRRYVCCSVPQSLAADKEESRSTNQRKPLMQAESAESLRLLLRPREAAEALAVCERTLWSMTASGQIPSVRIGRAVRYDPADLREWIEAQKGGQP